ncbi:MAG: GTPase ObgE [Candidatus Paceibacterota bacterium]
MLIDELEVYIKAGRGGNGVVRWLHEKGKEFGGPSGGNGGKGGDVYVHAIRDIGLLAKYRNKKSFEAQRGEDGRKNSMHGKDGKDITIDLPVGSVITNLKTGKKIQLLSEGETVMILRGGNGGLGNEHFKASTNVRPIEFTLGKECEDADFFIELELVADAGLIGFPNAGKSSLLNDLTNANAKVGSYQFTTLEPNLGDMHGFILADIPGLIEGASQGKGLGHKFLRHIKRTRLLIHLISLEEDDVLSKYDVIRKELEDFDKDLSEKEEVVVLTKTDLVTEKELKEKVKQIKKRNKKVFTVSILDDEAMKNLKDELVKILRKI